MVVGWLSHLGVTLATLEGVVGARRMAADHEAYIGRSELNFAAAGAACFDGLHLLLLILGGEVRVGTYRYHTPYV